MCRRQPLINTRIADKIENKDWSNKKGKPALSCNIYKATK